MKSLRQLFQRTKPRGDGVPTGDVTRRDAVERSSSINAACSCGLGRPILRFLSKDHHRKRRGSVSEESSPNVKHACTQTQNLEGDEQPPTQKQPSNRNKRRRRRRRRRHHGSDRAQTHPLPRPRTTARRAPTAAPHSLNLTSLKNDLQDISSTLSYLQSMRASSSPHDNGGQDGDFRARFIAEASRFQAAVAKALDGVCIAEAAQWQSLEDTRQSARHTRRRPR